MTPLDVSELAEVMTDLRHATGDKRVELLQSMHDLLDLSNAAWMLLEVRQLVRRVQWGGETGPMVDRRKCCPTCGGTPELGHITGCALGRAVEWLG